MSSNSWVVDLRYVIFTTLKTKIFKRFGLIYPDLFITDKPIFVDNAKFPTVYLQELPSSERSRDLEGDFINAVDSTWQVEVTMKIDDDDKAVEISQFIVDLFKKMSFKVTVNSIAGYDTSLVRVVSRFNRYISHNDTL